MRSTDEIDIENEVMRFVSYYHDVRPNGDEIQLKYCPFCHGGKGGHDI